MCRGLWEWLPFVVLLPLFGGFAWAKSVRSNSGIQKNDEHAVFDFDQHAYLNMGRLMRDQGYRKVVPRHRMPGFSFLLSAWSWESDAYPIDPTGSDPRTVGEGYFHRGKVFTIGLACLSLVLLYGICRRFLPVAESHVVTWSFAWLLAVIRAAYVQPEIVFYVLFLWSLILLWRLVVRPRWRLAAGAGLVLAAAFILKSTVVPLIALFLAASAIRAVGRGWRDWRAGTPAAACLVRGLAPDLGAALLVPLVFAAVLSPYLWNTHRMHGSFFWDVHSKHYMWMETEGEKKFWRGAGISDPGFVPPPGREVPSLATYFREHTLAHAGERLRQGWNDTLIMVKKRYAGLYDFIRKWLLPLGLAAAPLSWRRVHGWLHRRWIEPLMLAGFFLGYAILYSWYQIIGVGPRLLLALALPAVFFLVLAMHRLVGDRQLTIRGRSLPVRRLVNAASFGFIAVRTAGLLRDDFWMIEGGR